MKWTDRTIEDGIRELMAVLKIDRMPTNTEMRQNKFSGLSRAIGLDGGVYTWSEKLGIPMKEKELLWNDDKIESAILDTLDILQIERMPSASELQKLGRNDLHCAISKSVLKYSGWAKKLNLELKSSDTKTGNEYEEIVSEWIEEYGYEVKRMTTKHPFDLLVEGSVKIDVKVGRAHNHFGSRAHTFVPSKKYATCDLYICVALDEEYKVEKVFIIPSKFAQLVTLNICGESKYNSFIDRWDYIKRFVQFYAEVC
jgi:hypothetical protein